MNLDAISRYPLAWPVGWKRCSFRVATAFQSEGRPIVASVAIRRLEDELRRLGAKDEILSTNVPVRLDGTLRLNEQNPLDPGVAVYFTLNKKPRCLACDRYYTVAGNIAALAAHIEALRAIDRYGVGTIDQAFAGYTALPPNAAADWAIVLGVPPDASLEQIEAAFRVLATAAHPDRGGSHEDMARLNMAREAARRRSE